MRLYKGEQEGHQPITSGPVKVPFSVQQAAIFP